MGEEMRVVVLVVFPEADFCPKKIYIETNFKLN